MKTSYRGGRTGAALLTVLTMVALPAPVSPKLGPAWRNGRAEAGAEQVPSYRAGERIELSLTIGPEWLVGSTYRIYREVDQHWELLGQWGLDGTPYTCCGLALPCTRPTPDSPSVRIVWDQRIPTRTDSEDILTPTTMRQASAGRYKLQVTYGRDASCAESVSQEFLIQTAGQRTQPGFDAK